MAVFSKWATGQAAPRRPGDQRRATGSAAPTASSQRRSPSNNGDQITPEPRLNPPTANPETSTAQGTVRSRSVLTLFDQGLTSLFGLLIGFAAAQSLSEVQFGVFATLYTSYLIARGVVRSLALEPIAIQNAGGDADAHVKPAIAVTILVAGTTALVGLAGALLIDSFSLSAALVGSLALFSLLAVDSLRMLDIAAGRPVRAVVSGTILAVAGLVALLAALLTPQSLPTLFGLFAAAAVVAMIARRPDVGLPIPNGATMKWLADRWSLAGPLLLDYLALAGATFFAVYLLAFLDVREAGVLRAAQMVAAPLQLLFAGLTQVIMTEGSRARTDGQGRVVKMAQRALLVALAASLPYLAIVYLARDLVGSALGATGGGAITATLAMIVLLILTAPNAIATGLLRAIERPDLVARTRMVVTGPVFAATIAGAIVDGARGVLLLGIAVQLISLPLWWQSVRNGLETDEEPSTSPAPPRPSPSAERRAKPVGEDLKLGRNADEGGHLANESGATASLIERSPLAAGNDPESHNEQSNGSATSSNRSVNGNGNGNANVNVNAGATSSSNRSVNGNAGDREGEPVKAFAVKKRPNPDESIRPVESGPAPDPELVRQATISAERRQYLQRELAPRQQPLVEQPQEEHPALHNPDASIGYETVEGIRVLTPSVPKPSGGRPLMYLLSVFVRYIWLIALLGVAGAILGSQLTTPAAQEAEVSVPMTLQDVEWANLQASHAWGENWIQTELPTASQTEVVYRRPDNPQITFFALVSTAATDDEAMASVQEAATLLIEARDAAVDVESTSGRSILDKRIETADEKLVVIMADLASLRDEQLILIEDDADAAIVAQYSADIWSLETERIAWEQEIHGAETALSQLDAADSTTRPHIAQLGQPLVEQSAEKGSQSPGLLSGAIVGLWVGVLVSYLHATRRGRVENDHPRLSALNTTISDLGKDNLDKSLIAAIADSITYSETYVSLIDTSEAAGAQLLAHALTTEGVDPARIIVVSYGEDDYPTVGTTAILVGMKVRTRISKIVTAHDRCGDLEVPVIRVVLTTPDRLRDLSMLT